MAVTMLLLSVVSARFVLRLNLLNAPKTDFHRTQKAVESCRDALLAQVRTALLTLDLRQSLRNRLLGGQRSKTSVRTWLRVSHGCTFVGQSRLSPHTHQLNVPSKQNNAGRHCWIGFHLQRERQWNACELDANSLQLGIVDMSKLTRTD